MPAISNDLLLDNNNQIKKEVKQEDITGVTN